MMGAWLNPIDAERLGVVEGDLVRLYNEQGTLQMPVYLDEGISLKR